MKTKRDDDEFIVIWNGSMRRDADHTKGELLPRRHTPKRSQTENDPRRWHLRDRHERASD